MGDEEEGHLHADVESLRSLLRELRGMQEQVPWIQATVGIDRLAADIDSDFKYTKER